MTSPTIWIDWPAPVPNAADYAKRRRMITSPVTTALLVVVTVPVHVIGVLRLAGVGLSGVWMVIMILCGLVGGFFVAPRHRTLHFCGNELHFTGGAPLGAKLPWRDLDQVVLWLVQDREPNGAPRGDGTWMLNIYDQHGRHRYSLTEGPLVPAKMLFDAMDAFPSPRRRLFLIPMRPGLEGIAPPGSHPEWEAIARMEPTPRKVQELLAQKQAPGVPPHA